ncbi:MAG: hypothetical protein IKM31_08695 [Oscillospiraceae bacterium]|nr:hypothetical protein [Oscillospiraceae bacterium]
MKIDAWRCGLIDVGSNTVRAAVFEVKGSEYRLLADEKDFCSLIACIDDGVLSDEGVERLCRALTRLDRFCRDWDCGRIDCFATASLRAVHNFDEVQRKVAHTGVEVILLSGEEEALCDYAGLRSGGITDGVGLDLGGGSGQLFRFRGGRLEAYASYPIGVMAMKRRCSADLAPGHEDQEAIREFVLGELSSCPGLKCDSEVLYAMGGSVRAAALMRDELYGFGGDTLTVTELKTLFDSLSMEEGIAALKKVEADRLPTMGSGLTVLAAICEYVGAKRLEVVHHGVREGYLWKNIMKQL